MRRSPKLRPTVWDALVVLAIGALAVVCAVTVWGGGGTEDGPLTAQVSADGEIILEAPLSGLDRREETVTYNGYTLHLVLTETAVWVETADCPTQDCVHTGVISRPGQSIVCLPARVIVQLAGGGDSGVDAVIG